jgi:hypothetical protein
LAKNPAEFDRVLLSAIDEALSSLGESVRQSIYFHIESKFNVPRNRIPENLEEFQEALEKIFGTGARFIEILIMKNLYSKVGLPLKIEDKQLEFVKYVDAVREGFLKKRVQANYNF